jgi:hypothetical protein
MNRIASFPAFASIAAIAAIGAALLAASFGAAHPSEGANRQRRCVGVFVASEKRTIAADAKGLTVVGDMPCGERPVVAWATQGVYRAFDDGGVEFLATPVPPCPQGDVYTWIRLPNP